MAQEVRSTQDEQRLKSKLLLMWAFLAGASMASTAYRTEVFTKVAPGWCPNAELSGLMAALKADSRDGAKAALLAFFGLKDRNYDRSIDAVLDEVIALSLREQVKKMQQRIAFETSDAFAFRDRLKAEIARLEAEIGVNLQITDEPKEPPKEKEKP